MRAHLHRALGPVLLPIPAFTPLEREIPMSQVSQPRLRKSWVVLSASVVTSLLLAAPAFAGDVQLSAPGTAAAVQANVVDIIQRLDEAIGQAETNHEIFQIGRRDHQMAVEHGLGMGPQRLDDGRTIGNVRHEMSVHHVAMDPIRAS